MGSRVVTRPAYDELDAPRLHHRNAFLGLEPGDIETQLHASDDQLKYVLVNFVQTLAKWRQERVSIGHRHLAKLRRGHPSIPFARRQSRHLFTPCEEHVRGQERVFLSPAEQDLLCSTPGLFRVSEATGQRLYIRYAPTAFQLPAPQAAVGRALLRALARGRPDHSHLDRRAVRAIWQPIPAGGRPGEVQRDPIPASVRAADQDPAAAVLGCLE